jgi:hypothetical protein
MIQSTVQVQNEVNQHVKAMKNGAEISLTKRHLHVNQKIWIHLEKCDLGQ